MGKLPIGAIVAGTLLLAVSSDAFADIKAYHGGICRYVQTWAIRPDIYGYPEYQIDDYGLRNLNYVYDLVVQCPLIRDLTYSTTGAEIIAEFYNKDDDAVTELIRC